ncbi:heavy-metal-associated domain-containing protein, partial [Sandarakinorhabdus oryzae]|uniref:heavy-metal-associated domain-containing protein n=1 Tax=Sandarakinorhabdus oryzae TaxID=2675220 RepID=UPI0012E2C3F7
MKPRVALTLLAVLGAAVALAQAAKPPVAAPPSATAAAGNAYAVGGIDVDVTAKSVDDARHKAWTEAMRKAWPILWSRLAGQSEDQAPRLSDGQIDGIVAGIESQGERFSATRYIARLGVVFDRSRAAEYIGGVARTQSPPLLLLPLLIDGGAAQVTQAKTPWRDAWARWQGNVTPIDYVLPAGNPADNLWLSAAQVRRTDPAGWRSIITRFDTVDVLVAEARLTRLYPGGPIRALFIARHGPNGEELGRLGLRVNSEAGLTRLLDEGVKGIDGFYAQALRDGRLRADKELAVDVAAIAAADVQIGTLPPVTETVLVAAITPDNASLATAERLLRSVASDVLVRQVAVGGTSRLEIALPGGATALREALALRGWALDPVGADLVLAGNGKSFS